MSLSKSVTQHGATMEFEKKVVLGKISYDLQAIKPVDKIILDTSFLNVHHLTINGQVGQYVLHDRSGPLGSPLVVNLGRQVFPSQSIQLVY